MKTFNNTGNPDSYDIVHMKGDKDKYTITELNGKLTYESTSLDRTYIVDSVEEMGFKYSNGVGNRFKWNDEFSPFNVPVWIKIINGNTTINELNNFGDTTQISSTFYSDPTYGIGWGTNDDARKSFIINSEINFTEMYIEYSGGYNTPNQSLGYVEISDSNQQNIPWNNLAARNTSMRLSDGNSNPSSGQSLSVNGVSVYSSYAGDIMDRIDTLNCNHHYVSMAGYTSSYPYGKRYIKNLWVR